MKKFYLDFQDKMGNCCYSQKLSETTFENTLCETFDFTEAKVVKVHDGDTFWIIGKHNNRFTRFSLRLYGCDCPELSTDDGKKVRDFVKNLIENKIISVEILNNKIYKNRKMSEKYGRLLGIVRYNNVNLADDLIKRNYAVPYYGGTKVLEKIT